MNRYILCLSKWRETFSFKNVNFQHVTMTLIKKTLFHFYIESRDLF
jgi:hypothetical protein